MLRKRLVEPDLSHVLDFCAADPVERVFLEDAARRALGRFLAVAGRDGALEALCHVGANLVPSGRRCALFAEPALRSRAKMIIGEEAAVDELWRVVADKMPEPRDDRPGQPVYVMDEPP